MGRPHVRDFVDDRIKGRWQSLPRFVHFGDLGKAADMPKLDDRWNVGLWLGKSLASDEIYVGTSRRSPQVSIHLEAPREATLGQEDVD